MAALALTDVEAACWAELWRALEEPGHPWRLMALATVDGEAADLRQVVLRECRPADRVLVFFTDARSPKVRQLAQHPLGTLMVWSRALQWQLRLRCRFEVRTTGPDVAARWESLLEAQATGDYRSPAPPGEALDAPAAPGMVGHFALVNAHVERLDWLELHEHGVHRRAVIDAQGARWVAP
ncbi:pyridoxamine 5'-phosphate oxidase family protein [Aquabacterium humicola]|uniref:pyridoxamine 5'-phosphate oxidase family protein n=1 Tax=Aquabacterium humicola TaxID=3237377 RepID=UPI0025428BD4|nr:pyridoxamine 5'-phosphate oxidase family protein [Rubrivivax pictus]